MPRKTARASKIAKKNETMSVTADDTTNVSVVDLFCGVGGLTHGLRLEGLNVVAGIDLDSSCAYAYEANNGEAMFLQADMEDVTEQDLNTLYPPDHIKVLVGCAPCQPFSPYTKKSSEEDKWRLVARFATLILAMKPDIVSMENVPNLANHAVFIQFVSTLESAGYQVSHTDVNCVAYGIPQTRTRLVLFASLLGEIKIVDPPDVQAKSATVRNAIGHLEKLEAGQASRMDPLHRCSELSAVNLRRIRASRPGGSWRDWPDELRLTCHKKKSGASFGSVYGRMSWDQPAPTMTTQCNGIGNGRFGHPEQDRAISLREAALFQTFPVDYQFVEPEAKPNLSDLSRHIGNAVPVRLGEIIARTIKVHLADYSKITEKT